MVTLDVKVNITLPLGHNLLSNFPSGLQLLQPVSIVNKMTATSLSVSSLWVENKSKIHQVLKTSILPSCTHRDLDQA